jgi:hypothetical protein
LAKKIGLGQFRKNAAAAQPTIAGKRKAGRPRKATA